MTIFQIFLLAISISYAICNELSVEGIIGSIDDGIFYFEEV